MTIFLVSASFVFFLKILTITGVLIQIAEVVFNIASFVLHPLWLTLQDILSLLHPLIQVIDVLLRATLHGVVCNFTAIGTFMWLNVVSIAGFHCHTTIKIIQQIKSRIKEVKEDEHSNSLAKIQVCAIFRAGDIRRNVLLKFIRLCMETPCLCSSEEHKYGGRKLTETDVIEFAIKSL